MAAIVEMGRISSRGQIAIPSDIRSRLGLEDGAKVLFFADDDAVMIRKVSPESFAELTKPLRNAKKKINEKDVSKTIHKMRNVR